MSSTYSLQIELTEAELNLFPPGPEDPKAPTKYSPTSPTSPSPISSQKENLETHGKSSSTITTEESNSSKKILDESNPHSANLSNNTFDDQNLETHPRSSSSTNTTKGQSSSTKLLDESHPPSTISSNKGLDENHPLARALLTIRPYRPQTLRSFHEIYKQASTYYVPPLLELEPLPTAACLLRLKARRARIHNKCIYTGYNHNKY